MKSKTGVHSTLAFASLASIAGCATTSTTPHVSSTVLTKTEDLIVAKRVPTTTFSLQDSVVCFVYFQWDDPTRESGYHEVEWRWYKDGALVSQGKRRLHFKRTPYTTWTTRAAGSLGVGHFSVSTVLDGAVASATDFEITP
jgi:hypothetical protein